MKATIDILFILFLFAVCSSKMVVQTPAKLVQYFAAKYPNGEIPYSIANYGIVPYGKTVSGQMGTPSVLQNCISEQIMDKSSKSILLVQRNDCKFTQKSINVQKEGGKLAIIMDNKIEQPGQIIMADDGKGYQVKIPTILISKEDGYKFLQFTNEGGVIVSVTFQIVTKAKADLQIWIDANDHKNYIFLRNFLPYFTIIQNHVDLSIGYPTTRCTQNCPQENCFYLGKYCKYPFGSWGVQKAGQLIIRQQIRQFIIFKNYPSQWWDFMLEYDDQCDDLAVADQCSIKIMKKLNFDLNKIANGLQNSFGREDNQILKQHSEAKYRSNIQFYPGIVVNNIVYRGNIQPYQVFEMICQGINPQPEGCEGYAFQPHSNAVMWIVMGSMAVVLFIIFLIFCFRRIARRQLSRDMSRQVNELVDQYITMYETQKFKEGTEMQGRSNK